MSRDYYKNDDDCCAQRRSASASATSLAFAVLPSPLGANSRRHQNLVTSTKEESWGVSGQIDLRLGSHTLTSITAYRGWDNTEIRDGDWLPRLCRFQPVAR